jgi:ATP-dependent exoDNAse (exonuclease V) alpha subunit
MFTLSGPRPRTVQGKSNRIGEIRECASIRVQRRQKWQSLDKYPELDDKRRKAAWREFFTFKDEAFADLRPIHATTVHRSQGSTYEKVFVDLSDIGRNTTGAMFYCGFSTLP